MPVETRGSNFNYSHIADLVDAGETDQQIADALNNDFRHHNNCSVAQIFNALFESLQVIYKDLGLNADPSNDSDRWIGPFDTLIRSLPDTGQVNPLLRSAWRQLLVRGQYSNEQIVVVPDYVPQSSQQDDRVQKAAAALWKFDDYTQEIVENPTSYTGHSTAEDDYDGDVTTPEAVHAVWEALTGGRRFGNVSAADVAAVKQTKADNDQRDANWAAYQEIATVWCQEAADAAKAVFDANPTGTTPAAIQQAAKDNFAAQS